MRTMTAKYAGTCAGCNRRFKKGTRIKWSRATRETWHENCAPTGRDGAYTRDDREYLAGVADANRYMDDVRIYGRELAEAWEIEREMREEW